MTKILIWIGVIFVLLLGLRLLSLHNVRSLIRLSARARAAIVDGNFEGWSREWLARYQAKEQA
jgi:queuine tRNA-ribosyltransferase